MKLCVKLEDECIVSVSSLDQSSMRSTLIVGTLFIRNIVLVLGDSVVAVEGH